MSKARTLANLISDNAELADGQISVAEVVGAAPLASPTFTGTASGTFSGPLTGDVTGDLTGDVDLQAIAATISDTAVDIFVYDTRKDSDGGAWRKRTQGTSWYNETLNTATRGSRKEFPAVAVIVAEADTVTIYDGDDPDLPMWMVFNSNSGSMLRSGSITSTAMLQGTLAVGHSAGSGFHEIYFLEDTARWLSASTAYGGYYRGGGIANRNTGGSNYYNNISGASDIVIANSAVNDVAMTVLPNAPIDAATGLPVPTIAVATDGGVSVIKDDGTVVDSISATEYQGVHFVKSQYGADMYALNVQYADDPQWFPNVGGLEEDFISTKNFYANSPAYEKLSSDILSRQSGNIFTPIEERTFAVGMATSANPKLEQSLNLVQHSATLDRKGLVAYINSNHNTGWMNGDIKLATLSDTDDTNVTGSELVTNGTFDSTASWNFNAGWSVSGGELVATSAGVNTVTYQNIATTTGKTYTATIDCTAITAGSFALYYRVDGGSYQNNVTLTAGETASLTFTALSSSSRLVVYALSSGSSGTFDNVTLRLAEEDRSVNGNGLQVFGTVTKSAVATGADLVGYSFDGTDSVFQPYNSDLNIGTGDFCYMMWFKGGSTVSVDHLFERLTLSLGTASRQRAWLGATGNLNIAFSGYTTFTSAGSYEGSPWTHLSIVRTATSFNIYINGVLVSSETASAYNYTTQHALNIGNRYLSGASSSYAWSGQMALFRFSATAPSPQQILKIYNDEKVLFQENAQATLYGSSDAVTALAYDDSTNLLHVGTSAGRSVFQGLRRVDNTTDAVGAAISASNGLVAEE